MKKVIFAALVSCSCLSYTFVVYDSEPIAYPEGYREWTHVKTAINGPKTPASHQGFHHIYANDKAMEGYKSGLFPEGSIIVFDVLEAVAMPNGNTSEGERKLVDMMIRDHRYDSTGGWGYEEFKGNSIDQRMILSNSRKACFNCHASQEKKGFVFSSYRK